MATTTMSTSGHSRRGSLPNNRGQARLGYIYASPLVQTRPNSGGRKDRMELLDTAQELKMIREKLGQAEREIRFRAAVATPSNLREILNAGCRMLHYTGHGSEDFLAFESDQDRMCGVMEPLKVRWLKELFQAGGVTTELVFISSCSSERSGHAFVEAGVPHVVAVRVQERVTDQAAQLFGGAFYHALIIGGYTVQDSFDIGLSTVNASYEEGNNFLLLPAGGDHQVQIFDTLPEGTFVDDSVPLPPMVRCPSARHLFLGTVQLQRVVETLVDPVSTCVTVTGERGSGKTEMALQACVYVRERHRFDAIFFADCQAVTPTPTVMAGAGGTVTPYLEDPCRLVGLALGMPAPGPHSREELMTHLFTHPTEPRRRLTGKVLLVLDGVDAMFEGQGGDARDGLVDLLSYVCRFNGRLHLLMTSEQSVLRDTNSRIQNGSERVFLVSKLKGTDPAQLLVDLKPRPFKFAELKLSARQVGCSHTEILKALERHPVLQNADGHPGTLVRLAPLMTDHYLDDSYMAEMAALYRAEYAQDSYALRDRRNNSNNSINSGHGAGGGAGMDHSSSGLGHAQRPSTPTTPTSLSMMPQFSSNSQPSDISSSHHSQSFHFPGGSGMSTSGHHSRRQSLPEIGVAVQHLEPPPPQMTPEEIRAWDAACAAGLRDRGCRLVWVGASANAAAAGWGVGGGGIGDRSLSSPPPTVVDRVPWIHLAMGLQRHLCGTLTIPSSRDRVVDEGPYGDVSGEHSGGDGGMGRGDHDAFGEGAGYGALDFQAPRGMNDEELRYVRGVLKSKQAGRSGGAFTGGARLLPQGWGWAGGYREHESYEGAEANGSLEEEDVIPIEAFAQFSRWWAPLMITLSRLRKDWATLSPIVVHGFVGRMEAERKLQGRERGTFLFRFSERKPGVLAVSFTEIVRQAPGSVAPSIAHRASLCFQHCLVYVGSGGSCRLEVGEAGSPVTYANLHDLVMDCERLKTLYPNVPKEQVFRHRVTWEPPTPTSRFTPAFGGSAWDGGGGEDREGSGGWVRFAGPE